MSPDLAGVLQLLLGLAGTLGFAVWAHYFYEAYIHHGNIIKYANEVLAEAEMIETWIDDWIVDVNR